MFLVSGTFNGNFLECEGKLKLPPDLSFFDLRNYHGAIPAPQKQNIILQKLRFGAGSSATSHLMVSLCVYAKDNVGRDGFFACREISQNIRNIEPNKWFVGAVRNLVKYLHNEAPLENGSITHIPVYNSDNLYDFSNLQSRVENKRLARVHVEWPSSEAFQKIFHLIDNKLLSLESFALIFGADPTFDDVLEKKLHDWHEEVRLQELIKSQNEAERRRKLYVWRLKKAEENRVWDQYYKTAEMVCVIDMIVLALCYFLFSILREFQLNASDPLLYYSIFALVVGVGRAFAWALDLRK